MEPALYIVTGALIALFGYWVGYWHARGRL